MFPIHIKAQGALVALSAALLAVALAGCSSSFKSPTSTTSGPQLYMSPVVNDEYTAAGAAVTTSTLATYSIDDTAETFAQATYSSSGEVVNYSGSMTTLKRGLLDLDLTYDDSSTNVITDGWAVELASQDGGLLQLQNQPFVPLVPAVTCPSMSTAETFQFVTLPAQLLTTGLDQLTWNPNLETAYGSVDISASGSTVTLANIQQYTLPSTAGGAAGSPSNPSASSVTGACSSTVYGETVAIPAVETITNPGSSQYVTPPGIFGIGPSGLLVESNGNGTYVPSLSTAFYETALGAGTGSIGLPKPSRALDTTALVGAQYLGFFYGSGESPARSNWSSSLASFGFASQPASCVSVATQTSTMLYGGDFTGNNPAATAVQSGGGYGNCDFAIDFGAQDPSNNGLYPAVTVYVGSGFAANTTGKTYNFSAVAIAGQLNGKYAIFLIGEDLVGSPNQAWGIYLLQSN
jgi:hypothetical protein